MTDEVLMVWLDLDDTLWDFHGNSLEALADTYIHFGLDRFWSDVDSWRDDYHRVNDRLWAELSAARITRSYLRHQRFYEPFTAAGMDAAMAEELTGLADVYYLERLGCRGRLVDGAADLLQRLRKQGHRTGILSNGFHEVQYNKMRSAGIDGLIDVVVLSDEIDIDKPDVRLYRYAERKAGVTPDRCVMIGDNGETDIAGAMAAGWGRVIWYNARHRQPGPALRAATVEQGPCEEVDNLSLISL